MVKVIGLVLYIVVLGASEKKPQEYNLSANVEKTCAFVKKSMGRPGDLALFRVDQGAQFGKLFKALCVEKKDGTHTIRAYKVGEKVGGYKHFEAKQIKRTSDPK